MIYWYLARNQITEKTAGGKRIKTEQKQQLKNTIIIVQYRVRHARPDERRTDTGLVS